MERYFDSEAAATNKTGGDDAAVVVTSHTSWIQ